MVTEIHHRPSQGWLLALLLSCCAIFYAQQTARADEVRAGSDGTHLPGTTFRDCSVCPEMKVVPPGTFTMGRKPAADGRKDDDPEGIRKSAPAREATIGQAFAVGTYAVTRAEYSMFVRETGRSREPGCYVWKEHQWTQDLERDWRDPGFRQTDRDPVVCVNWGDAQAYVRWLNSQVHLPHGGNSGNDGPYRLMSLAEAEYAAGSGATTAYSWGPLARRDRANYGADRCFPCQPATQGADRWLYTSPVGSFPANGFGLYDMSGDVWQWTDGCYPHRNPPPTAQCRFGVVRGGSWLVNPEYLRLAEYAVLDRQNRNYETGFRVARTLE